MYLYIVYDSIYTERGIGEKNPIPTFFEKANRNKDEI
jgi:hypothetical protein